VSKECSDVPPAILHDEGSPAVHRHILAILSPSWPTPSPRVNPQPSIPGHAALAFDSERGFQGQCSRLLPERRQG
jgi:hypothetical protein